MVKLADSNKAVLNHYGNLEKLSLPDALFRACRHSADIDGTCYIQLMQCSAELLHPSANFAMGINYKYGCTVEKTLNWPYLTSRQRVHVEIFGLCLNWRSITATRRTPKTSQNTPKWPLTCLRIGTIGLHVWISPLNTGLKALKSYKL